MKQFGCAAPGIDESPIAVSAHLAGGMDVLVIVEVEGLSSEDGPCLPQLFPKDCVLAPESSRRPGSHIISGALPR